MTPITRLDLLALGLVLVGLAYTLASRDKLGLVIAFAGVTLLTRGLLSLSRTSRSGTGSDPRRR